MRNAFSEEFYDKPKISETCSKNFGSPLESYESFMGPCIDLLYLHSSKAMDKLREYAKYYRGEKFENHEFKPLRKKKLWDYFLFQSANMAYKTKAIAQNNI